MPPYSPKQCKQSWWYLIALLLVTIPILIEKEQRKWRSAEQTELVAPITAEAYCATCQRTLLSLNQSGGWWVNKLTFLISILPVPLGSTLFAQQHAEIQEIEEIPLLPALLGDLQPSTGLRLQDSPWSPLRVFLKVTYYAIFNRLRWAMHMFITFVHKIILR